VRARLASPEPFDGRLLRVSDGAGQCLTAEMSAAELRASSLREAAERAEEEAGRAAEELRLLQREEIKRRAAARLARREAEVAAQQAARRLLKQQKHKPRAEAEPEWLAEAGRAIGALPEPRQLLLGAGGERDRASVEYEEVVELRRTVATLRAQVQALLGTAEERNSEGQAAVWLQPTQEVVLARGVRESAALRLQTAERGRAARATVAQRRVRASEASEGRVPGAATETAATQVQAAARGWAARTWVAEERQSRQLAARGVRECGARRIQAALRALRARRLAAGLRRQSAAREWRRQRTHAAALQPQEEGRTAEENSAREFQEAREAARQVVARARRAVVRMQAAARGWAERRQQVRAEAAPMETGRVPRVEAGGLAREVTQAKEAARQRVRAALAARGRAVATAAQKEASTQREDATAEGWARYEADMELWGLTERGDLSRLEGAITRLQGVASLEVRTEARQVAAEWRAMARQKEQVRKDARHAKELQRIDAARDGEAVLAAMLRASALPQEEGKALEGALEAAYAEVRVAQEEAEQRQSRERPAAGPGRNAGGPPGAGRSEEMRVRKAAAEARARAAKFEAMIKADAALKAYTESMRGSRSAGAGGVHQRCWEGPRGRGAQGRRGQAAPRGR